MKRRSAYLLVVLLASVWTAMPVAAQEASGTEDPIFSTLFPPELIMQHRRAIDLTDQQRDAISGMIQDLQGRVVKLQWQLLDRMQELTEITGGTRVDLDRAIDKMGEVLDLERGIKQAHLEMLVRIKNLLSVEQQRRLAGLRGGGGGTPPDR